MDHLGKTVGHTACNHCWHPFEGTFMMVLHSGEMLQECCKCHATQVVHRAHAKHW